MPDDTITVNTASLSDRGNYTCAATNVHGTDIRSVSVDVVMPPTVILVSRLTATSARLVWKHVERSEAYRLSYTAVPLPPSNRSLDRHGGVDVQYYMRSYTFAELRPDTRYRFCISVRPTSGGGGGGDDDVIRDGVRSPWTVDCVEVTTPAARDADVGLTDVGRYVISGCAVVIVVAVMVCVTGARRRCGRGDEWPAELSDGGSSGRLSPTAVYADSSADYDDAGVVVGGGTATWNDVLADEVYENVMTTRRSPACPTSPG